MRLWADMDDWSRLDANQDSSDAEGNETLVEKFETAQGWGKSI